MSSYGSNAGSKPTDAAAAGVGAGYVSDDDEYYMEQLAAILDAFPKSGPPKHPCRVFDHVYIGSQDNADDLDLLPALGITHVLNMAGTRNFDLTRSPYKPSVGIKAYLQYQAEDYDEYDIVQHFPDAMVFLDRAKLTGGKALVHCSLGVNRSGAVVAAYMMVTERRSLLRVAADLKAKRSLVLANVGFRRQLVKYARCRGLLDPVDNRSIRSPARSSSSSSLTSTAAAAGTSWQLPRPMSASYLLSNGRPASFIGTNGSVDSYQVKKNFDDAGSTTITTTSEPPDADVSKLELRDVGGEKTTETSFEDVTKNNGITDSNGSNSNNNSRRGSNSTGEEVVVDLKRNTNRWAGNGGTLEAGRRYPEILTNGNGTSLIPTSLSSSRRREQLLNDVDAVIGKAARDDSNDDEAIRQKNPLPSRYDTVPTIKLTNGFHHHHLASSDDDLDDRDSLRRLVPDFDNASSRPVVDGYGSTSSTTDFSSSAMAATSSFLGSSSAGLRKSSSPFDVVSVASTDFVQSTLTPYDNISTAATNTSKYTSLHRRPLSAGLGLRDIEPADVKPMSYYRQAATSEFNSYRRLQQDDDEVNDYLLEAERRSMLSSGSKRSSSGSTSRHVTTAASSKVTPFLGTTISNSGLKSYRSSSVPDAYSSTSAFAGSLSSSRLSSGGSSGSYRSYVNGTSSSSSSTSGRLTSATARSSSYSRRPATRSKLMAELCEGLDPVEYGIYSGSSNGYLDDSLSDADANLSLYGRLMPTRVTAAPGHSNTYTGGGYSSSLFNGGTVW